MNKLIFLIICILIFTTLSSETINIGKDKILHFTGSAFLTYWNYGFQKDILNLSENDSFYISIGLTNVMAFSKEFSDKHLKKTKFSWTDIAYDIAGISVGIIIIKTR